MSGDFRPREHDHLVEPLFGGLGAEGGPEEPARAAASAPARTRGLLERCLGFLRRLVGQLGRRS